MKVISQFAVLIVVAVATISSVHSSSAQAGTMTVKTSDGGTIQTKDFIHNGVSVPAWEARGYWLLAGKFPNCVQTPKHKCVATPTTAYQITYIETTNFFNISLDKKPLGKVRQDAEQFLIRTLGVTPNQLCRLNYTLSTYNRVDQTYAGVDLRFSFCPGATPL